MIGKDPISILPFFCVALLTVAAATGCDDHDIGKACPELLDGSGASGSGTSRETQEVVGESTSYHCDEFICIATEGKAGYCSKRCIDDTGCPEGFECREIQDIGVFEGQRYCAWKRCNKRSDCGSKEDFCCRVEYSSDPAAELEIKLCAFSEDGKC